MGFWAGRKVVITGGAGFIGSHCARQLLELGSRVRIVDSLERAQVRPAGLADAEFLQVDLTDPEGAWTTCRGQEVVIHMASRVGSSDYYARHAGQVFMDNLLIDVNTLRAAVRAGAHRYFYPSSSMVYPLERQGSPDAPMLREEEAVPANPPNSYGWAKLIGEQAIVRLAGDGTPLRAAIIRFGNVFGPGQDFDLDRGSVIPVLTRRAVEFPDLPFVLRGSGEETRAYCYVTDAVDALLHAVEALEHEALVGPLNVTGLDRIRILDLAQEIVAVSNKAISIQHLPGNSSIKGQILDCTRARERIGFQPRVTLREGLRNVYDDVAGRIHERTLQ